MLSSSWQRDTRCGEVSVQGPLPSRSRSTPPAGRRESGGTRGCPAGERGGGTQGTALHGPAGGSDTPARPSPPRLPPLRWAGTRRNFLEAKVGRRGWPGEPRHGPAVGPVRPVPVRGRALLEEARTGAGGPRSPLRALSSGSFLAMGSLSPRARRSRDGGWTGTGNREWGTGPAPGAEQPGPTGGGNLTHTQVYVYLN